MSSGSNSGPTGSDTWFPFKGFQQDSTLIKDEGGISDMYNEFGFPTGNRHKSAIAKYFMKQFPGVSGATLNGVLTDMLSAKSGSARQAAFEPWRRMADDQMTRAISIKLTGKKGLWETSLGKLLLPHVPIPQKIEKSVLPPVRPNTGSAPTKNQNKGSVADANNWLRKMGAKLDFSGNWPGEKKPSQNKKKPSQKKKTSKNARGGEL